MRTVAVPFTKADYARLPEGFPAQLVAGTLVKEPSPTWPHQGLATELVARLRTRLGRRVVAAPVDVVVDETNVYQPDVAVYREPVPIAGSPLRDAIVPIVVFEVLSPTTERRDRGVKRRGYLRAGVEEVWVLDPATRTIEVHRRGAVRRHASGATAASEVVEGIAFDVAELFASA